MKLRTAMMMDMTMGMPMCMCMAFGARASEMLSPSQRD